MGNTLGASRPDGSRNIAIYLGERIVTLRTAAGLNTNQLAEKAGIRFSTLSELEEGKHTPSLRTLLKLLRALELSSIEDLTGGTAALLWLAEADEGLPPSSA